MSTLQFDAKATEHLVALYTTPDIVAQREQFLRLLQLRAGERVLDVGSGPGFLADAMAQAVGPTGAVCGVEISEPLLAFARAGSSKRPWIEYRHGDAVQLPVSADSFDVAVSTQVLEYVADVDTAIAELFRVLRRGGRVAIMDTEWDSAVWHTSDRERMQRVLAAWEVHAPHARLPRRLRGKLQRAGFRVDDAQVLTLFNPTFDPETYSNRMIDMIAAFVRGRGGIAPEEAQAWAQELRQLGAQGEYFFSLNRYVFLATKP